MKIGVLANRGSNQCLAKWGATAEYLTAHVPGFRFEIVPLGYADVQSAVAEQRLDFILVNPAMYVALEAEYKVGRIATMKNRQGRSVAATYGTVILCRADSQAIRSLDDLRGKSFMAPEENSFGGWLMALRELRQKGIDPYHDFKSLQFSGTQDGVVLAILHGEVDAGAIRTDTLERMAGEGKIQLGDFLVISAYDGARDADFPYLISTRTYPEWPLAKLQHTPLTLVEEVAEHLRQMPPDATAAKKADIAGWTYPGDYNEVRKCL
ncbi:MAG TPA: phosphate/phosphite/phosphonate ABC transporter substrate-binding protein, partial [Thermoguttaceae bacterium]